MKYTHTPLNEDIRFLAGTYALDREERISVNGREVFYLGGQTSAISTCCGGAGPFSFIKVVGFVNKWHCGSDEKGTPISEIEPVRGEELQTEVKGAVQKLNPDIDPFHIDFY